MGLSQFFSKIWKTIRKTLKLLRSLLNSSPNKQTTAAPPQRTAQPESINSMTTHVQGYGWIPDRADSRDLKYSVSQPVTQKLPLKVDLRAQLPPVYAQGPIGSCTAQSICAAFHFCQMKEKLYNFAPSRLFTYYTTRDLEGTVNEDSGAMLRDTIKSINKFGACPESIWPYDINKLTVKPTVTCYDTASRHTAVAYYQVSQNLNQMKGCLAEGYPFAFGMTVYDSFEGDDVANTGVVQMPSPDEQVVGGHAVLVVGYDDSQQRFIVRNSWGSEWGMGGYFTLPYAYIVNPDLATDFWTLRLVR
jgi:C1A family cysteine protease